jgi:hypothetical protein
MEYVGCYAGWHALDTRELPGSSAKASEVAVCKPSERDRNRRIAVVAAMAIGRGDGMPNRRGLRHRGGTGSDGPPRLRVEGNAAYAARDMTAHQSRVNDRIL